MKLADRGLAVIQLRKDAYDWTLSLEVFARVMRKRRDHDRLLAA